MNIVTPYPTNIPLNTSNVSTELARRDNQLRDLITKPSATEAGVAERGIASENDKSKPTQQTQSFDGNNREVDNNPKINERGQGQGGQQGQGERGEGQQGQNANSQGREQQGQSDSQSRAQKLAASKRRLAEVEAKLEQLDLKEIRELKSRDAEVRTHEQAHAAAGGKHAGSPSYTYQKGPDGRNYAVGGEVQIDTAPVAGDPQATIEKMQQVRAAASAPAQPSGQDRKVAASASQAITKALAEQVKQKAAEQEKAQAEQAAKAEQAQQAASANASEDTQNTQDTQPAQAIDPFAAQFEGADDVNGLPSQAVNQAATGISNGDERQQQQTVAGIFGGSDAQINLSRAEAEARNNQRASDVLARASRIQSFYAGATKPRETGFTSFA